MNKKYTTENRRHVLRQLILFDVALFVLAVITFFIFPDPPEITAATEVMAEIKGSTENNVDMLLFLTLLCLLVVILVLLVWAWKQLYQLDQRGVAKYLWVYGLLILMNVIAGGGWSSSALSVIDTLDTLCSGAIMCICCLCPEVFRGAAGACSIK